MGQQVTLGGERLGSGKKMKVDMHGFERSTHDMSYIWRSTMSSGTLVPFLKEVALPGDTFDIHLNCDIKTHPTTGPLFGSYKVQLDVFSVPMRLYHAALHNNRLGIGMNMAQVKLPIVEIDLTDFDIFNPDIDNCQINPSCILSYLGIRGVGFPVPPFDTDAYRVYNAIPILAYWDIYKNYYANKQEEIGAGIHLAMTGTGTVTGVSIIRGTVVAGSIPHYPTVGTNQLQKGDVIAVSVGAPNTITPEQVTIQLDTYGPRVNLYDLLGGAVEINPTSGTMYGTWDINKWGPTPVIGQNWEYLSQDDALVTPPRVTTFPLENIDKMKDELLAASITSPFNVSGASIWEPYNWPMTGNTLHDGYQFNSARFSQEGLGIKCYQSDLFNNWLSTEWIDGTGGINEITAIDTSGGSFNIDTLNLSKKVYDMLNRIAVSGGSYKDWLSAVYDHDNHWMAESPIYVGGLSKELVFQEVVSNSESADGQPLGTLAGRGVMSGKHKGGNVVVRVDEPSYIMGIVSLTPRLDYSQGNKWDVNLRTLDDLHKPSLDQIGFQELIAEQMAWWSTYHPPTAPPTFFELVSIGKQPAWINYMTNVNEVRGNFAIKNNEMFMTLNRRYEPSMRIDDTMAIKDATTYIDPVKFNHIFANTALDAQNFWTQISIDMIARRKMSAKVMPNL
ncbi:MAG: major capsid protein [Microviridae sp.]|nr:MAG: major capsid protein [Microviridae sp.]